MRKALDNPWISRAGNLVFLAGAAQSGIRLLMGLSLNAVGVVLFAAGLVLMASPHLVRRRKQSRPAAEDEESGIGPTQHARQHMSPGSSPRQPQGRIYGSDAIRQAILENARREDRATVEAEFVTMIEEGKKLCDEEFTGDDPPSWFPYQLWREDLLAFIATVFGDAERQRLIEVEPLGPRPRDHITPIIEWLRERRDDPESWTLKLGGYQLAEAVQQRRAESSRGGEFGRRDDGGELARRCHMLAGSVERWVESFNRGHSERAERMVEEWLGVEPEADPAEARRRAYERDEKNWQTEYAIRYRSEAKKLFDEAYEMGEIAKEHEQLAIAPLPIQFEAVPRLFNEIAERLYGDAA